MQDQRGNFGRVIKIIRKTLRNQKYRNLKQNAFNRLITRPDTVEERNRA